MERQSKKKRTPVKKMSRDEILKKVTLDIGGTYIELTDIRLLKKRMGEKP